MIRLLFLLQWLAFPVFAEDVAEQSGYSQPSTVTMPPPLTEENFYETISSNLHIVEFFSPYCHHCKDLAPTWESTYKHFYEESKALKIEFHQVNCVESGDLCDKEAIRFYPNIRLYGAAGFIKAYPSSLQRTEADFIKFAREEALNSDNLDIASLSSKSEPLGHSEMVSILTEPQVDPYLISFWPSSDFHNMEELFDFHNCQDCSNFQRLWKITSNKVLPYSIKTGHFNCFDTDADSKNSLICDEVGFHELASKSNHRGNKIPRVALIVPDRKSGSLIKYPFDPELITDKSLLDFAVRVSHNSNPPVISVSEIETFVEHKAEALEKDPNLEKILLVFNCDKGIAFKEDLQFLEQLTEPLLSFPNVYLYKNSEDLLSYNEKLFEQMYKNYNLDPPVPRNEDFFLTRSITQLPTFFIFKNGNFIPNVFPGFSTTETRNLDLIIDWLSINSIPLTSELNSRNYKEQLHFKDLHYEKMVIQLIDRRDNKFKEGSRKLIDNLEVAAHQYEILRNEHLYDNLKEARANKKSLAEDLKNNNAPSTEIIQALRKEIETENNHKVLFKYLDINDFPRFLDNQGLNVKKRQYKTGDIIIVDKQKNNFYYEKNQQKEYITSKTLPEVLAILNFPKKYPNAKIERILVRSPFGATFRFLDNIHQFGFLGYFTLVAIIFLAFRSLRALKQYRTKKRYFAKRNTQGILGKQGKNRNLVE